MLHIWTQSTRVAACPTSDFIMAPAPTSLEDIVDYYEFLSIPSTATDSEIQRAYRRTNLKYHPDKFKPTPDTTAEQAAEKLDLLQKILAVLKDPADKAKYDQGRAARQQKKDNEQKLAKDRRILVEKLEKSEVSSSTPVIGAKRNMSKREEEAANIGKEMREKREKMTRRKQEQFAQQMEDVKIKAKADIVAEPEEEYRSLTVLWINEGDGLDIDQDSLKEAAEVFGPVDHIIVGKVKKRRLNGQKEKVLTRTALICFQSLAAAEKAIKSGPWNGIESISWTLSKDSGEG